MAELFEAPTPDPDLPPLSPDPIHDIEVPVDDALEQAAVVDFDDDYRR